MTTLKTASLALLIALPLGLAACSTPSAVPLPDPTASGAPITDPVPAPTIATPESLAGTTVEVPINSQLVLDIGDLDVESFTAEIADPTVAEFIQGSSVKGDQMFRPGVKPLKVGTTTVTLTNKDTTIAPVTFTLTVTPKASN
jgi:hypothetical protein